MSKLGILPLMCALAGSQLFASVSVQITAPASTIEVGQSLTLTATARDSATSNTRFSYQFTVRPHNVGAWIVMQDYYWNNTFTWTPSANEGAFDIGVTAWSEATHNAAPTYMTIYVNPRVTGSTPVISSTANALVALYSAPACPSGQQMRVEFSSPSATGPVYTPYKPCTGSTTMNFYLGGMLASTTYTVQHFLTNGTAGPQLTWTTGSIPSDVAIPGHEILAGPTSPTSTTYPFLLHATDGAAPYATDLKGRVVWYRTPNVPIDSGYMVRMVPGGTFLTIDDDPANSRAVCGSAPATECGDHQFLREYDMAGNIVRSTSWAVVSDYVNALRAMQGGSQVRLNFFSHDALRLPNGYTVVLATDEEVKTVNGTTQDVFGDMVIVFDTNLEVAWAWDAFDYLPINRNSIGGICVKDGAGCPSEFFNKQPNGQPYTQALDWTHANSLFYDPSDGNLVVNFRSQSWAVKINYLNGTGNGNIIWTFGYGGSFALASGYPVTDWPSGEHNVEIHSNGVMTMFDNNNPSTLTEQPGGDAHGQAWILNTDTKVATPIQNIDLGVVSEAVGTAEQLMNGNAVASYYWQAGFINGDYSQAFEFTPTGTLVFKEQSDNLTYRTFRVQDLYTPTT